MTAARGTARMGMVTRVGILVLAFLTLAYFCVYFYLREGQKMRLQEEWVDVGRPGDRDAWVAEKLAPIADKLLRRLILWVYVLPVLGLCVLIYLTN